jgi:hypothetical protein
MAEAKVNVTSFCTLAMARSVPLTVILLPAPHLMLNLFPLTQVMTFVLFV